jgi:hypothetical protein
MIVDTHTHLWQNLDQLGPQISAQLRQRYVQAWDQLDAGFQAHDQAMERIDVSFIWGFRSRHLGAEVPNTLIATYVGERPDRRIGFAGIDPMDPDCLTRVSELPSMRLSGIVVSPADQAFHPCHSRAMKVYELCQSMNLPVLVETGRFSRDSMMEYAPPYLLDEVARSFPQLKMLIGQTGFPFVDQTLALVGKHRNVYAAISGLVSRPWQLYNALLQAHLMDVTDRLLLGSDFPFLSPQRAIEAIYSINQFTLGTSLPSVPREKLRAIVERDALACLGLKRGGNTGRVEPMSSMRPATAVTEPNRGSK